MNALFDMLGAICGPGELERGIYLVPALLLAGLAGSVVHCTAMCGPFVLGQVADGMARMPAARMCQAARVRGALLLVDIDHFKRINDQQGHASGDAVLVEVARRLAAAVRPDDLVVRWGGEEFLIYAPQLDAQATRALAQRVLHAVADEPVVLAEAGPAAAGAGPALHIAVTASVGFACFPQATGGLPLPMDRAINLVDMALYTAKNQGRHRAVGIQHMQAADDAALRAIESDFDSAWREARMVLDLLPGTAEAGATLAPVPQPAPAPATATPPGA